MLRNKNKQVIKSFERLEIKFGKERVSSHFQILECTSLNDLQMYSKSETNPANSCLVSTTRSSALRNVVTVSVEKLIIDALNFLIIFLGQDWVVGSGLGRHLFFINIKPKLKQN